MKIAAILFLTLFCFSCKKLEKSGIMYEEGRVTQLVYSPERRETVFETDYEGNSEVNTHFIPEKYTIGFSCQHGGFKLSNSKAKEIFYNFLLGDQVIISYRQIDSLEEKDGKIVGRHFEDWEFVGAEKIDKDGLRER